MSGLSPLIGRLDLPPHLAERARLFEAILAGRAASRRDLGTTFELRSTTISEHVGDLIAAGLVVETQREAAGRGRPSKLLLANPHRLAALVYQVESQAIRVSCVNLVGQEIRTASRHVPDDSDAGEMTEVLRDLYTGASAGIPRSTVLAGISLSLSGILDAASRRWLFSSRWPRLGTFDVAAPFAGTGLPVRVARNLDVELSARLAHGESASGGTLLVHWGWGIGAAYAVDGEPVNGGEGRFGEIGHWRLNGENGACRCGRNGCLETVAALWALAPRLGERWGVRLADEESAARGLRDLDLLTDETIIRALHATALAIGNLCRVLFPRRVIISGPFVANPRVWSTLRERLHAEAGMIGVGSPEFTADQRSRELEREGAAVLTLRPALEALLRGERAPCPTLRS